MPHDAETVALHLCLTSRRAIEGVILLVTGRCAHSTSSRRSCSLRATGNTQSDGGGDTDWAMGWQAHQVPVHRSPLPRAWLAGPWMRVEPMSAFCPSA